MKKTILSSILILFLLNFSALFAQTVATLTPAGAINTSGKQRFLSQRMGKNFIFLTFGLNPEIAQRELASSKIIFEENLKALKAFPANEVIKQKLDKEEKLWLEYKKLLELEPNRVNATNILNYNTALLTATDDVVQEYVKYTSELKNKTESVSAATVAVNTNTSGRIRMLSQRLTLYYGAYYSDCGDAAVNLKTLKAAGEAIQASLSQLITSDINTSEIDDSLSDLIIDWHEIEERCTKDNCLTFENKQMDPKQMFTVCNKMLSKVDKAVGMYAKLLD